MREVADVHRPLFPEHADEYGDDVRAEARAVPRGHRLEEAEGAARRRAAYRERALEATAEVDLVLTPTLPCVAPPVGIGDGALRERLIRFTYPFNSLGWPALALPCGAAEDGLPASAQLDRQARRRRARARRRRAARGRAVPRTRDARARASCRKPLCRMTKLVRHAAVVLACLAWAPVAHAQVDGAGIQHGPQGLKAFLLRVDEPARHEFPRTPSFAWTPVRGAKTYSFELATSRNFNPSSMVWSSDALTVPADGRADRAAVDHRPAVRALRARPRQRRRQARPPGARRTASTCAGTRCRSR